MSIKLSEIEFIAGPSPSDPPLTLSPSNIVILVGPNNSGKSLALREIEAICCGKHVDSKIIKKITEHYSSSPEEIVDLMKRFESTAPPGNAITPGNFWVYQHSFSQESSVKNFQLEAERLRSALQNKDLKILRSWVLAFYTVRLDGRTRFFLTDPKGTGDLQQQPQNHLWALFKDDQARNRVRELTEKAFGLHFVIDPTGMTKFKIRMSTSKPLSSDQEQSLNQMARTFHAQAAEISSLSDGIQAFVGLVSAVMSLDHKILLIDEPEAFLHPPLSRRLGSDLTKIAKEREATLVISTHSAPFVMGCVESSENVNIVRLTYENGLASARKLDPSELKDIFKSALLRSTNVIQGLFHRAVVVTESDSDRAFYDEINRRLIMSNRGINDALFLNAQNMTTVARVVAPLRRLGIPAAAIVDFDFITQKGINWDTLINACEIPEEEHNELRNERDYFLNIFKNKPNTNGKSQLKMGGVSSLSDTEKERFHKFNNKLSDKGLFIVPNGELESWLSSLGVTGHGTSWLINIFNAIGDNDDAQNFLSAKNDDVWEFLDQISTWVNTIQASKIQ